jgi:hypothetical protein
MYSIYLEIGSLLLSSITYTTKRDTLCAISWSTAPSGAIR